MMWYNYARFGSVIEFGAHYQLTSVDVTDLSDRYKDIPRGLYEYLIKPFKFKAEFPYIENDYSLEGHTENYYNGGIVAGILFLNLSLIICFWGFKYYKKVKDKLLKQLIVLLPIVAIVLCIVTVVSGGTVQRYAVDFFWMFSMLSMLLWFLEYQNSGKQNKKKIYILVLVLIMISVILNFFGTYLNSEYNYLSTYYPNIFEFFK